MNKLRDSTAKRLLFVSGTRADYGKLEPLATEAVEAGFRVTFFVTGMHTMSVYGLTKEEIHRHGGFEVFEFVNHRSSDSMDVIIAKTITCFSDFVNEFSPDLVVIHGDRAESLAVAIVCATNYIRCAHVEGGELSGTIDESFRHAITKLAHFHFVSNEDARSRVISLGEKREHIFLIGSPEMDVHTRREVDLSEVVNRYSIPADYGVCIFHPVTSELAELENRTSILINALKRSERAFVVILPNNDPGSEVIVRAINDLPRDKFRILPSMRFSYFSTLLRCAKLIVGNSSSGVREAPFFGTPSVNIGSRQANRSSSISITDCPIDDEDIIVGAIEREWGKVYPPDYSFGRGDAVKKFIATLNSQMWNANLQKAFQDAR